MVDGAQCSLPRRRQSHDRTTECPNESDLTLVPKTGIGVLARKTKDKGGVCVQPNSRIPLGSLFGN